MSVCFEDCFSDGFCNENCDDFPCFEDPDCETLSEFDRALIIAFSLCGVGFLIILGCIFVCCWACVRASTPSRQQVQMNQNALVPIPGGGGNMQFMNQTSQAPQAVYYSEPQQASVIGQTEQMEQAEQPEVYYPPPDFDPNRLTIQPQGPRDPIDSIQF